MQHVVELDAGRTADAEEEVGSAPPDHEFEKWSYIHQKSSLFSARPRAVSEVMNPLSTSCLRC